MWSGFFIPMRMFTSTFIYPSVDSATMPLFIILGKLTDTAIAKMKEAQERDEKTKKIILKAGGNLISHYYTFGRYDFVAIVELASPEILARVIIEIAKCGAVSTETMTALLPAQMYEMAKGT